MTTSAELRNQFLQFFENKGHSVQPSSSLIPINDATLLFTNAGMVQFKDTFLGKEKRPYTKATTSQRCVRAGGKHNDLENVGYTARHHTFFEMLGNFSFGDYFKREAIQYAWEFLTVTIGLPADKLWVTVYADDAEAETIWLNEIKIDPARFSRIGDKKGGKKNESDNFWQMGDTGPCGPCSEIFFDHGEAIWGGPPGTADEDGDRYIEIWNLVFMQYERDKAGVLTPLPKPSVDTGMGLERLAAILQNVHNNYDIDLFQALIKKAGSLLNVSDLKNKSLRVIADHIRSCSFLIVDGVLPSNEGRGYVLRRIIRRAARHGHQLGKSEPFFYSLVGELVKQMGEAYPELKDHQQHVESVLQKEETRFAETLAKGMKILQQSIDTLTGDTIPGDVVFTLYDTYGFPADLTADFAREKSLKIDQQGFDAAMIEQRNRARSAGQFHANAEDINVSELKATDFSGYELQQDDSRVTAIYKSGKAVETLNGDDNAVLVLTNSPFYAESGGQVGDSGLISNDSGVFKVNDTQKQNGVFLHYGVMQSGSLTVDASVQCKIDTAKRNHIIRNHSATHLMHAALQEVLGEHVQQKGSLVDSEKLRFDFSHHQPVTDEEKQRIEYIVNEQIRENLATKSQVMSMDEAKETGAMALFGEKYGDEVRVLNIGSNSVELCGGVHVKHAGDIGVFKIYLETGVASGVRRLEAVTGELAFNYIQKQDAQLNKLSSLLKTNTDEVGDKVAQLVKNNRSLEKEIEQLKSKIAAKAGGDLTSKAKEINGIQVLAALLEGADVKALRETMDQLKNKLGKAAIVLASVNDNKITIIAGVTKAETKQIKAGDLVNVVAIPCGGKGGGRPDMAQAGGNKPENLESALNSVEKWVQEQLS